MKKSVWCILLLGWLLGAAAKPKANPVLRVDTLQVLHQDAEGRAEQRLRLHFRYSGDTLWEGFLHLGNWSYLEAIWVGADTLRTGRFVPLLDRPCVRPMYGIPLRLMPHSERVLEVRMQEQMGFYAHPADDEGVLILEGEADRQTARMLFYQGIFLGIILVMGLYNLFIFSVVRDKSFLYYVISIFGVGHYFMFYYGFSLEIFWPHLPVWDAYSFAFVVPLTRMSWIAFTQQYLNIRETLPRWQPVLYGLMGLYALPMVLGLISWQGYADFTALTVSLIAILGIVVLTAMIILGVLAWQAGYKPARYFLIANIFFSVGSILFIFRETGWLPDTFLTRYASQVGVIVQVTLFSLGLGNRLNQTRRALSQKTLEAERLAREKEIEKKQRIQAQKASLEQQVAQRTADLNQAIEQLRDLNQLKDHLFSVISHDLRTPLTSLSSLLNLLTRFSDQLTEDEKKELAQDTEKTLKNVLYLLDNLLHWASSQMNTLSFVPSAVQLRPCVEEVIQLFEPQIKDKQLEIVLGVPAQVWLRADAQMLATILRNLCLNAIKFTPKGGRIIIRSQVVGDRVHVTVQDTGVGMSAAQQDKLFSPQAHMSTTGTQNEQGTGLGLLLCKAFVDKHQGQISISSQPGEGTAVHFVLPAYEDVS